MARVRYAARSPESLDRAARDRSVLPEIWSTGVVALWETDPEVVAAVLPPPLVPADVPLVRANIAACDINGHPLGAGAVAVRCRHGAVEGDYTLTMPMTTERAVIGGREVFGEPKKLAEVTVDRDGDGVVAKVTRHGVTYVEIRGRVAGELPLPEPRRTTSFYYKFLPAVDGDGFDADPMLVHVVRHEKHRWAARVEGEVILRDSAADPVADLPVRRLVSVTLGERTSDQKGFVAERVKADLVLPYIHQRYDDIAQIADDPPEPGDHV
ncbi:acetoacetate decarboxylase family protein [Yinghuangia sp. ASG 101]|uniref:acetoacetate decarboxylase family protein n=1 Tax=Yinghuangia sp. ASG 101 TaxID=2896848 RepID=UPI001E5B6586|nr:acetoacetate decarboxylase family protein [Yinghuangia sp. ASG 101]UGQ10188.1 acetoacetate decarboxylase family protein [Yinghuangia sp. ASG 101]